MALQDRIGEVSVDGITHRTLHLIPENRKVAEDAPVLVFLHEGLGRIELWRDFPHRLCQMTGLSGMVYDRRGYGGSTLLPAGPWPKGYLIQEGAVLLPGVLTGCGIKRAILIGHSDGGTIALVAAALSKENRNGNDGTGIIGLITEAAHIFVEEITVAGIREAVDAYEKGNLREKLLRHHGVNTDALFYRWADTWLSKEFRSWNMEDLLPKVECPVLVMQGEKDEYGTVAQVEGIAKGVSGHSEIVMMPGCGHIPHLQDPDAVLEPMAQFIEQIAS